MQEIAGDRGVAIDVAQQLVDDALKRGLLAAVARGVTLTPAGLRDSQRAAGLA